LGNPIKYNPNGDSKVSGVQRGEWLMANAATGVGPTSETEFYSQLKEGQGIYTYDEQIIVHRYEHTQTGTNNDNIEGSKTELIDTLARRDKKANGAKEGWVCMETNTYDFTVPYDDTRITEIAPDGTENILGIYSFGKHNIPCTAAYRYIGSPQKDPNLRNPIHMQKNARNYGSSCLGLQGNQFGYYSNRGGHGTFYAFALGNGTIKYYEDGTGINGTPIQEIKVTKHELVTFQATTDLVYSYITSTTPIVVTAKEGTSDKVKLFPADKRIFSRRSSESRCLDNTSTNINTNNKLVRIAPTDKRLFAQEIGDGGGSDACQGVPLSCLSNTYIWGNKMTDFSLISPYIVQVTVEYYDSGWKLHGNHTLIGSMDNPGGYFEDGDGKSKNNKDPHPAVYDLTVDSNDIEDSGSATEMRGGVDIWRFRAHKPFAVIVNDQSTDEVPIIGWMEDRGFQTAPFITDDNPNNVSDYTDTRPDWLIT
jgi:hypothetical protein